MPLNFVDPGYFLVAETILYDGLNHSFLEFRCITFVWYPFWHSKAPHLLVSISYCLTNGVQFKLRRFSHINVFLRNHAFERLFFIIPNFSASVNRILPGPTVYISFPL